MLSWIRGKKRRNRRKLGGLLLRIASSGGLLSPTNTNFMDTLVHPSKPTQNLSADVWFLKNVDEKTQSDCYDLKWKEIPRSDFKVFWMHVHLIFCRKKCCKGFKFVLGQCIPEGRETVWMMVFVYYFLDSSPIVPHEVCRPLTYSTLLSECLAVPVAEV